MAEIFNIEEYIKDLTPEQLEKARACKTKDELMELAAEEDIEIPMEVLESVAGGCDSYELYCKDCGSKDIGFDYAERLRCCNCHSYNIRRRVVKE